MEWIALRPTGLAYALRAEARFDYRRPFDHGPVIDYRSSHVVNALDWLLTTAEPPAARLRRSYVQPNSYNKSHRAQRGRDDV